MKDGGGEKSVLVKQRGRHFDFGECGWSCDPPHSSGPKEESVTGAGLRRASGGQLEWMQTAGGRVINAGSCPRCAGELVWRRLLLSPKRV